MRFPSIKRYRISGGGTFYGDETFKTGLHILDEVLGGLLAKKNKITYNTE